MGVYSTMLKLIDKWYQYYINHKWLRVVTLSVVWLWILTALLTGHFIRFLLRLAVLFVWRKFFCFDIRRQNVCSMVMGPPGAGKTSFLCWLTLRYNALSSDVMSNVAIKKTYEFGWERDFGNFLIDDKVIFVDEAALEKGLNNREFATNFAKSNFRKLECLKLHRHFRNEIFLFSQADDADLKVRELCQNFYLVKKIFPFLIKVTKYVTDIDVDPMTQDFRRIRKSRWTKFLFTPVCWLHFDTEEVPFELQIKDFRYRG